MRRNFSRPIGLHEAQNVVRPFRRHLPMAVNVAEFVGFYLAKQRDDANVFFVSVLLVPSILSSVSLIVNAWIETTFGRLNDVLGFDDGVAAVGFSKSRQGSSVILDEHH